MRADQVSVFADQEAVRRPVERPALVRAAIEIGAHPVIHAEQCDIARFLVIIEGDFPAGFPVYVPEAAKDGQFVSPT